MAGMYAQWWFFAIGAAAVLAESALALRVWSRNRLVSAVALILLVGSGVAAAYVSMDSPDLATVAVALLAAIHVAFLLLLLLMVGSTRGEITESGMATAHAFGAVAVPIMATRANLAGWGPDSASAVPASVVALLAVAFFVGRRAYRHMMALERRAPSEQAPDLLAITWFVALSTVVAGILSIVLVAGQLGFDVEGGRRQLDVTPVLVYALVGSAGLCLFAAAIGWFRRPTSAHDDKLRVSRTAVVLSALGLTCSAGVLVADLVRNPWGWTIAVPYFVVLGLFNAFHYLEEIIQTQVRIHCLDGEWPAWVLGCLCALNIVIAVVWLGERVLWGPGRQGALLVVTAKGIGVVAILLGAIFAANLVVATGSGPHQQLSVKSSASNAVQSQLLYGAQLIVTTCVPSIVVSMFRQDPVANWKPLVVAAAFAGLMWSVANFAHKNNSSHLASERRRPLSESVTRRQSPEERRQLQAQFVARLSSHIALQEKLSRWTFKASLLWPFVLIARLFDWVKETDDPPTPSGASV
ncbi:hypothetical protein [Kribbella sp. C-35]|uniref:hypothetical protein n=1 Tax=Kribbella sp. C-35 TaxID=2789276 RepID=UPI00397E46B5